MLFIEYDVDDAGLIEVIAVIDAFEQDGLDPDASEWIDWRKSFEDAGHGCVGVPVELEEAIDAEQSPTELLDRIEMLILADRSSKGATHE